jgi:hypothetical protein
MFEFFKKIAHGLALFFVVAPWEQAIRVRLGKRVHLLGAGFYLRVPFIDRVFKQSVRRRLINIRVQTLTTSDGRTISCTGALGFAIVDLRKLYDTLESATDTIENECCALIARFIGQRKIEECRAPELEQFVRTQLDLTRYGLHGDEFYLTSFCAARTLRLITGEIHSYNHDGILKMQPDQQ